MKKVSEILKSRKFGRDYRCSHEFQAYGNRLAEELGDKKHRTLYIKLAKTEDRNLLEEARVSVLNSKKATTKGRLFMWKLGQLKKGREEKKKEEKAKKKQSRKKQEKRKSNKYLKFAS